MIAEVAYMDNFIVVYYDKPDGTLPAAEFIETLDAKMRAKFYMLERLLSEYGNSLREPYSKHLDDGIFEIRARQGTDIARVLYFFVFGKRIILLNGFTKKTQKTPKSEIATAKRYRAEFLLREDDES
jgi:phage-related protein